jgi:hypothetical protein
MDVCTPSFRILFYSYCRFRVELSTIRCFAVIFFVQTLLTDPATVPTGEQNKSAKCGTSVGRQNLYKDILFLKIQKKYQASN